MNRNNTHLYILALIFYFIGDLATTYIGINNGMHETGLIRIITSNDFTIMVIMKTFFFIGFYFLIILLEKRDNNYLCGAILGLVVGMGMTITWLNAQLF